MGLCGGRPPEKVSEELLGNLNCAKNLVELVLWDAISPEPDGSITKLAKVCHGIS